jgi:ribosomal protein S18 acetylase RimI-like enzyme
VSRTRSEYRLHDLAQVLAAVADETTGDGVRRVERTDYDAAARLMLDAYRGTVDDEGEGDEEARAAIDHYFGTIEWPSSVVLVEGDGIVAMSFVVIVDGRHYIDPVATSAAHKRRGLGRTVVLASLRALAAAEVDEVGAVITDGNEPSELLFRRFGFQRVGAWG